MAHRDAFNIGKVGGETPEGQVYVCIVKDETNEPSNVMGPMDNRQADRVASGAGINLNWSEWHIAIVREDEIPPEWLEGAE